MYVRKGLGNEVMYHHCSLGKGGGEGGEWL